VKNLFTLLCFALSTGVASAAPAEGRVDAVCTQLSSDVAAQSALFSKVVAAPGLFDATPSAPAAARQRVQDKEVVLHTIANEIWSLRTRMAYLDCAQAKDFAY